MVWHSSGVACGKHLQHFVQGRNGAAGHAVAQVVERRHGVVDGLVRVVGFVRVAQVSVAAYD
jgi:hypothetical protein